MSEQIPSDGRVDVVIPVYRERAEVVRATVEQVLAGFADHPQLSPRVYVVDDGNTPPLALPLDDARVEVLRHETNRGYGAAIMTAIRRGQAPIFGLTDADGTYPAHRLAELAAGMSDADMVVGVRTGGVNETPLVRRPAKWALNRFASYLVETPIVDLNSGLRTFRRELAEHLWDVFPQRFSFVSTLTLGAIVGGFRTREVPIDYHRRLGSSSISPIRDTWRFFRIALRLGVLTSPSRTFTPVAVLCFVVGAVKGIGVDWVAKGEVGNLSAALLVSAVQIGLMGLLGEITIGAHRLVRRSPR